MERRSRAAHAGQGAAGSPEEWVGVGFRIGDEQFVAARDQVREYPGRSAGFSASPTCAATCCPWST